VAALRLLRQVHRHIDVDIISVLYPFISCATFPSIFDVIAAMAFSVSLLKSFSSARGKEALLLRSRRSGSREAL